MDLLTNNYWSENYNVEPVSEVADTLSLIHISR